MIRFAQTCERVASIPAKLEKIRVVAEYLAALDDDDLAAAARYFTGNPFAQRDQRNLSIGSATIVAAARNVWGFTRSDLGSSYRQYGDLGSALSQFLRPVAVLALFNDSLSPATLKVLFDEIAAARGKAAAGKRKRLCERILGACTTALEAKYVVKIMTGDLRIGLREGLIVEAVAAAFARPARDVRNAAMVAGDLGEVAVHAKHDTLKRIGPRYGTPIGFMLASPVPFGSSYNELARGQWILEDKFDGIRAQIHKQGLDVRIFSRTLNDVSSSYPEIAGAVRRMETTSMILDGEIIAQRDGRVLPFRSLQARLGRKEVTAGLLAEVPVTYACFDILALNERFFLEEPWHERRKALTAAMAPSQHFFLAHSTELGDAAVAQNLHEAFERSRAEGHEGLVLKRTDSVYFPGRRGKWWLKLKRELSTLDVVVVAVEWGHGKRAQMLSDYTFAVRDQHGTLLTIGKAYSGLADVEIARNTRWFLDHRTGQRGGALTVEPQMVIEVAFDIIQESELHESGFALRFPRIVRMRDDKPATEIDTLEGVKEIYEQMLIREGSRP